ncbi:MAG: GTP-binding protein [Candidatus Odinarchaeota archaeon]
MVNIGILGDINCGKTAAFILFMKYLEDSGHRVLHGVPGGAERDRTETVDFIRFTYRGFVHVIYGTGGHKKRITDYYRKYVLRNADRFLCIVDLSEPLESQLEFFDQLAIPSRSVAICFNKYDLAAEKFETYRKETVQFFTSKLKKMVKEPVYPTVAIEKDEEFQTYNQNCLNAILTLCGFEETRDAFEIWNGQ